MEHNLGLQEEIAAAATIEEEKGNKAVSLQRLRNSLRSC